MKSWNQNPFNWTNRHKYTITLTAVFITTCTAINCTSVAIMATWGPERFKCSREAFELSFTVVLVAISFTPMALAPMSEIVGFDGLSSATMLLTGGISLAGTGFIKSQGFCPSILRCFRIQN